MMGKPQAILLLGPTGAGKTPLGEMLASRGLDGARCAHFDFGERLRRIVAGQLEVDDLAAADRAFIIEVLERGALLENEHFHIAEKILRAFLAAKNARPGHWIVLNGLPRHAGQADDVDRVVEIRAVVELACAPETVHARLAADTGGDRSGRVDDDPAGVRRKLELYARRTEVLLDHYRQLGANIITVSVGPDTTSQDMLSDLSDGLRFPSF